MSRSEPLRLPALRASSGPAAHARNVAAGAADVQLMGQPSVRRGLREGAAALDRARTAYLAVEWSGADDRRPRAGVLVRGLA